ELHRYKSAADSFRAAIRLNDRDQGLRVASIYSLGMACHYAGERDAALEQQKVLAGLDLEKATTLLALINKISGEWTSTHYNRYRIEDDGEKIIVSDPGYGTNSTKYEATWAGQVAIGYELNRKARFVLRLVDADHIWFRSYGGLNLKEAHSKVVKNAIK